MPLELCDYFFVCLGRAEGSGAEAWRHRGASRQAVIISPRNDIHPLCRSMTEQYLSQYFLGGGGSFLIKRKSYT